MPATEWCQRYLPCYLFSVSNSGLLFFHVAPPGRTAEYWFMQYRTSDFAENLGRYLSCMRRKYQKNDIELILMIKIETRHPTDSYFGSEFWVICNHCGVMADRSRKTWKFGENFFFLFWKRPIITFSKFFSESFHSDTACRCCVQISWKVSIGKWPWRSFKIIGVAAMK